MKHIVYIFGLLITFISCNTNGFDISDNGIEYKFIEHNKDSSDVKIGDIVLLDFKYTTETDSVLFNSREETNKFRMRINEAKYDGSIDEALLMMHVGDSAIFKVNAMDFYILSRGMKTKPDFISPDDKLIFYVRLKSIMDIKLFNQEKKLSDLSKTEQESELLDSYLKNANITIEPTNTGLYYLEEKEGIGKTPKPGDTLVVNYTGKFINGQIFDTSLKRGKPIKFKYGYGSVIKGWEEGLSYMKKSGKAQFIIPSYLAYGEKGYGPVPPYSTLIFEIELVDIY